MQRCPHPRAIPGYAAKKAPGTSPTSAFRPFGPKTLASWRVGAHRTDAAAAGGESDPQQPGDHHREALELRRRQPERHLVVAPQELDEEPLRAREHEVTGE